MALFYNCNYIYLFYVNRGIFNKDASGHFNICIFIERVDTILLSNLSKFQQLFLMLPFCIIPSTLFPIPQYEHNLHISCIYQNSSQHLKEVLLSPLYR